MKAEELRIGNFVTRYFEGDDMGPEECTIRTIWEIVNPILVPKFSFEPIPLTEDWLIKFGFERNNNKDHSDSFYAIACGICALHINPNNGVVWIYRNHKIFNNPALINHVHSLQNLYFALTGMDLLINEPKKEKE